MELSLEAIVSILGLFIGGSGGAFFTWRYARKKAKAEAEQAEVTAAKESQDVYQQVINDLKEDREYQRQMLTETKTDRDHYKEESKELRRRMDEIDETVRRLQREVARNGRMVECMRPFLCGREGCINRLPVTISDGEVTKRLPDPELREQTTSTDPLNEN